MWSYVCVKFPKIRSNQILPSRKKEQDSFFFGCGGNIFFETQVDKEAPELMEALLHLQW